MSDSVNRPPAPLPEATGPHGRGDGPGYRLGGVTGRGFTPGRSGNPAGLGKGLPAVRRLARRYSTLAIRQLVDIAVHSRNDRARVMACIALLDRAWGKPAQLVGVGVGVQDDVQDALNGRPLEIRLKWPGRALTSEPDGNGQP